MEKQERFCYIFMIVVLIICLAVVCWPTSCVSKYPQVGKVIDTQYVYVFNSPTKVKYVEDDTKILTSTNNNLDPYVTEDDTNDEDYLKVDDHYKDIPLSITSPKNLLEFYWGVYVGELTGRHYLKIGIDDKIYFVELEEE